MANGSIKKDKKPNEVVSFEKGIEKLEQIVGSLDQNDLPLDEALARFQDGIELVRHCNSLLDVAEDQVKKLIEDNQEEVAADNV